MPATRMANVDAAWLGMDMPENLMMITAVLQFDGPADWDRLTEVVGARLVRRYPKFTRRAIPTRSAFQQPVWADDPDFDLCAHLDRVRLDIDGQGPMEDLVGRLLSTPLDMRRSPWRFTLVDQPDGRSAIVARLHHCLADGIALASVLLALTDDSAEATVEGTALADPRARRPGLHRRVQAGRSELLGVTGLAEARLRHPREALALLRFGLGFVGAVLTVLFASRDPRTRLGGRLGIRKRAAWSPTHDLAEVKRIGAALDASVNDVLLAATAGALRRYLIRHDGHAHDLRIFVPVNLRPPDQPIPADLGNRFGLVFLRLPVGEPDPVVRVTRVRDEVAARRRSTQPAAIFAVLSLLGAMPSWLHEIAVRILGSKSTAIVTNVPGPRAPVYLAGTRLGRIVFWVPQAGSVGLGVSVFSYAGEISVGVAADAGLVDDPHVLVDGIGAELDLLSRLTGQASSARRSPS